jgi:CRISPR-associated endoribonuclease Cas6
VTAPANTNRLAFPPMRVHLDLVSQEDKPAIPVNYNHLLSRALLKILAKAEPAYQAHLRTLGLKGQFNKRFRLFTFSSLQFYGPRWNLEDGVFIFEEPLHAKLILSFAHPPEFVKNEFIPLLDNATLVINSRAGELRLRVASLETKPFPQIQAGTYKALAPITISRKVKDEVRYLSPRSYECGLALADNLVEKYELLTGERLSQDMISLKVDPDYLSRAPHPMKVFNLDEGTPDAARVRAFLAPVRISGDPRLIRLAFACGLGERNWQGFGLLAEPSARKFRSLRKA